jgi:hypothetical protein
MHGLNLFMALYGMELQPRSIKLVEQCLAAPFVRCLAPLLE